MRRVRMRSSGERRTPVSAVEATGRRSGCARAKERGESERVMVERSCVSAEWMSGWSEASRKDFTQPVAVPKLARRWSELEE